MCAAAAWGFAELDAGDCGGPHERHIASVGNNHISDNTGAWRVLSNLNHRRCDLEKRGDKPVIMLARVLFVTESA